MFLPIFFTQLKKKKARFFGIATTTGSTDAALRLIKRHAEQTGCIGMDNCRTWRQASQALRGPGPAPAGPLCNTFPARRPIVVPGIGSLRTPAHLLHERPPAGSSPWVSRPRTPSGGAPPTRGTAAQSLWRGTVSRTHASCKARRLAAREQRVDAVCPLWHEGFRGRPTG